MSPPELLTPADVDVAVERAQLDLGTAAVDGTVDEAVDLDAESSALPSRICRTVVGFGSGVTSKSVSTLPWSLLSLRLAFNDAGNVTSTWPLSEVKAIGLCVETDAIVALTWSLTLLATMDPPTRLRVIGPLGLLISSSPSTPSTTIPPLLARAQLQVGVARHLNLEVDTRSGV